MFIIMRQCVYYRFLTAFRNDNEERAVLLVFLFYKISKKDLALPEGCKTGDIMKIERKGDYAEVYYRVVI